MRMCRWLQRTMGSLWTERTSTEKRLAWMPVEWKLPLLRLLSGTARLRTGIQRSACPALLHVQFTGTAHHANIWELCGKLSCSTTGSGAWSECSVLCHAAPESRSNSCGALQQAIRERGEAIPLSLLCTCSIQQGAVSHLLTMHTYGVCAAATTGENDGSQLLPAGAHLRLYACQGRQAERPISEEFSYDAGVQGRPMQHGRSSG